MLIQIKYFSVIDNIGMPSLVLTKDWRQSIPTGRMLSAICKGMDCKKNHSDMISTPSI